ncbi:MAG: sugar ABC transporter ATP-binding protein [Acidimicrobiales bacterium]
MSASAPSVRLEAIDKKYPGVHALRSVDLVLEPGEVHVLAGENGSGKSTLMKVLAGAERPGGGRVVLDGAPVTFRRVSDAWERGIALVSQELALAPHLSVAENIFLGHRQARRPWGIAWGETSRRAEAVLARLGVGIDPDRPAGELPIDQQQLVEIARAISSDARVLILDEPTSSLDPAEVGRLFEVVRGLVADGLIVVFISHRLREMLEIGDRFTVLRDGARVAGAPRAEVDEHWLVRNMVGRELSQLVHDRRIGPGDVVMSVDGLTDRAGRVRGISFEARAGEILGLAGIAGAGRTELLETVVGLRSRAAGSVTVDGVEVPPSPRGCRRGGVVLVPDDRRGKALVMSMSVGENLGLTDTRSPLRLNRRAAHASEFDTWKQRLAIKVPSAATPVSTLSGGNQQKVVVARAMREEPRVLLLDEPTRGVDIGAKADIYGLVADVADSGAGVVVASSEIPELLLLCDRILVFHHGVVAAELTGEDMNEEAIVAAATGMAELEGAANG